MPRMRQRPRHTEEAEVNVDFIISEGHRIDRIQLGRGPSYYGMFVGLDVGADEPRETADGTARHGLLIYLPSVTVESVLEALHHSRAEEGGIMLDPFPPPTRGRPR